jgi:hypothetical protein
LRHLASLPPCWGDENPAFTGRGLMLQSAGIVGCWRGSAVLKQRASSRQPPAMRVRYSTRLASRHQGKLDPVSLQPFTGWPHSHCLAHGHASYIYILPPPSALKPLEQHCYHHDGPGLERHLPQTLQPPARKLDTSFPPPHQATMAVSISTRLLAEHRTEWPQRHAGVPVQDDPPRVRSKGIPSPGPYLIQPRN